MPAASPEELQRRAQRSPLAPPVEPVLAATPLPRQLWRRPPPAPQAVPALLPRMPAAPPEELQQRAQRSPPAPQVEPVLAATPLPRRLWRRPPPVPRAVPVLLPRMPAASLEELQQRPQRSPLAPQVGPVLAAAPSPRQPRR